MQAEIDMEVLYEITRTRLSLLPMQTYKVMHAKLLATAKGCLISK